MNKKIIAVLLSIIIISSCCLNCFVYADDVPTIYYLYNVVDFTRLQAGDYNTDLNNYNLNFNDVSGYLKNDINYGDGSWTGSNFSNVFINNNLIDKWVNSVNNDYTVSNQNTVNFKGIESPDIVVNGEILDRSHYKTVIATDAGANMPSSTYIIVCSVYVPDDTICFLEQGRLMTSKNDVYYAYNIYQVFIDGDYLSFSKWGNTSSGTNSYYTTYDFDQNNTPDLYQLYVTLNGWFYSDIPVYYSWANHSDGEGAFLNQSPYFYGDYNGRGGTSNSVGKYVLSSDDTTGFIIDRRTSAMIDDNGSSVTPSQYGFKQGSFHNAVYGSTFDDQKLFIAYELNDSSKTIKNDLYLKLDYIFDMDGIFVNNEFDYSAQFSNINGSYDLYSLSDSNYINVSLDSVFDKMSVLYRDNRTLVEQYRNIYKYFNPASDGWVASPSQVSPNDAFDILYKNGLLTVSPVSINYSEQFLNSLSVNYKEISFGIGINANAISNDAGNMPRINRIDSCYITIIESVYNVVTGEESNVFMYTYNYITKEVQEVGTLENGNEVFNGYTNGSQSSLNNPNSDNMNYNTSSGQYLPNAYGGSSSASVGDIIINSGVGSIPYILVDIPENEWMSKTPNLNTLLTEFKTMLAETHEQSVLNMLPATYNYLPAPFMQYMLYGVGLIVMIGIWRAITRR